jgi:hypothetical protein
MPLDLTPIPISAGKGVADQNQPSPQAREV